MVEFLPSTFIESMQKKKRSGHSSSEAVTYFEDLPASLQPKKRKWATDNDNDELQI